jgi:hypothetical protein
MRSARLNLAHYPNPDVLNDYVVLLHGLGRTRWSMYVLERTLSQGFRVINIGYPLS